MIDAHFSVPELCDIMSSNKPQKWQTRTPAMSAGLTDHIWTMQELLAFRVPQVSAVYA